MFDENLNGLQIFSGLQLNPKKIFTPKMTLLQFACDLYKQLKSEKSEVLADLNIISADSSCNPDTNGPCVYPSNSKDEIGRCLNYLN